MSEKTTIYAIQPPKARPSSVTEIVDHLMFQAIKAKASDFHLGVTSEASGGPLTYMVRLRVHGKLQPLKTDLIGANHREILSRFKVMAGLSTTEMGSPQDGQISVSSSEGPLVLRLSFIPNPDGEELVVRFQRSQKVPSPDQLGMTKEMLQSILGLIQQKSGLIVLNGPAGSGKTTTIYSLLSALASPEKKIITAEDPIELRLPFVSHTAVGKQTSFARLSRSFIRQDADVIFIGEVRDLESAEAAIQLAQTGHLVMTTLHTRDALGVIPRLEAFGIHPNFIASTLIGSLAQRLVPRLCPKCRVEVQFEPAVVAYLQSILPPFAGAKPYKVGPGCDQCSHGLSGRLPIFELLTITPPLSDMINRQVQRKELLEYAQSKGMLTLAQEALVRVYAGLVDLDAVKSYLV